MLSASRFSRSICINHLNRRILELIDHLDQAEIGPVCEIHSAPPFMQRLTPRDRIGREKVACHGSSVRLVSDGEMTAPSPIQYRFGLWCALLCLEASAVFPSRILAGALDQLSDLTDKAAQAVVTLKGRDNFNSEYHYDVSVKNLSSDPLVGESLLVILSRTMNISGDEWMAGTSESNLTRMEILGQDGETDEGKPYFRIARGSGPDLPPYTESSPATVRIRNKGYLIVFTP